MLITGRADANWFTPSRNDTSAALTTEVSVGIGEAFDTSDAPPPAGPGSKAITHGHALGLTLGVGFGGFVSDSVAVLLRGTCTGPNDMCFLGPTAQVWLPGHHIWISAGVGLGADPSCIGRETYYGTDTQRCSAWSDGFDARVGVLLNGKTRGTAGVSLAVEFIQVGTFAPDGTGDALSFQLGYQWH